MKIEKGKSSKKEKITQNMNPVGWGNDLKMAEAHLKSP